MLRKPLFFSVLSILTLASLFGGGTLPMFDLMPLSFLKLPAAEARKKNDKGTAEPSEANLRQGLLLIRQGNYEAAIDSFQQAIYFSRNNYNPAAYKYLGICLKATRQYGKAIEALKTLLSQSTEPEPDGRIDLAECLLETGQIDKAREEIGRAFVDAGNRGNFRQRFAMGELQEKMKNYGQALSFYESALEEKSTYTDAAMGIGRMNVLLKRYNEALKAYRNILDKGPLFQHVNREELYYNMGTCFLQRGDHQGALDHWRMGLEENPDSFDCHLGLGRMLDDEKHYSSAIKEYEAALRCLPDNAASNVKDQIMRRLQYVQASLAPREAAPVIKPSPQMRQEFEDSLKKRDEIMNTTPPPTKDSGF